MAKGFSRFRTFSLISKRVSFTSLLSSFICDSNSAIFWFSSIICHVEVWSEASGTIPQLARVAGPYSVSVYSCSGFDSLTSKYALAQRICSIGKPAIILHLGDYDPDGESIFKSVAEDVRAFVVADRPWGTVDVDFVRVALTEFQVLSYDLPTAPPKASSSRTKQWGDKGTCQLEALPPDVLAGILLAQLNNALDQDQLYTDRLLEQAERQRIAYSLPAPSRNGSGSAS